MGKANKAKAGGKRSLQDLLEDTGHHMGRAARDKRAAQEAGHKRKAEAATAERLKEEQLLVAAELEAAKRLAALRPPPALSPLEQKIVQAANTRDVATRTNSFSSAEKSDLKRVKKFAGLFGNMGFLSSRIIATRRLVADLKSRENPYAWTTQLLFQACGISLLRSYAKAVKSPVEYGDEIKAILSLNNELTAALEAALEGARPHELKIANKNLIDIYPLINAYAATQLIRGEIDDARRGVGATGCTHFF